MENNETSQEVVTKRKFKKRYVILPIVGALVLGAGTLTGVYLYSVYHIDQPYTPQDDDHYPNKEAIMAHYLEIKNADKDYTKLAPYEAINVGYSLYSEQERASIISVGESIALFGIKQSILTTSIQNEGKNMEEYISLGTLDIYDRMYQEGDNTIKYWGDTSDYSKDTPINLTNEEYKNLMGKKVSDPCIYIISGKTQSQEDLSGKGLSKITKLDDGYGIDIELDIQLGVLDYQKQMQEISELAGAPSFSYLHLYYQTDLDLNLKYMVTYEKYEVISTKPIRIRSGCTGSLTSVFLNPEKNPCNWIAPNEASPEYPKSGADLLAKYGY